ncbi:MAG: hypothetical protein HY329_04785, partial [Chloroflexi bacterium]|nr:hypothetical protein [Chloroflexota bacterium]
MKRALVFILAFILFGLSLTESLGIAHGMPSLLGAFSTLNQAAGWQQITANGASDSPSARFGPAVAWDAQAGRLLLFGGRAGTSSLNDLWQYTSTNGWQQLTPSGTRTAPPGRQHHSAVWDSTNNRLLVFGGTDGSLWFGDLWQYTSADGWRQLGAAGTAAAPPPRYSHAAAWDSQLSRLLVFGGYVQQVGISNDLWEYTTAGGWKLLTRNDPQGSPPARYDHAAVWDAQSNRLLVFAGTVRQVGSRNDLWQYTSAGGWQMLTADGASAAPLRRAGHTAVWDTQSSRTLVFGGEILTVGTGNDLWQFTAAGGWQQLTALRATGAPPSRTWHGAAWDNRSNRLLVFGGLDRSTQYNDLWQYGAVAPPPTPTPASTPTPVPTRTPPTQLATVVGRVQLSDGTVPADDQILVLAGDGSGRQITARVTGGAFTLSLPAGTYQLTVLSRDDRFEPPAVRSLTVAAGERRDLGTISLVERPSAIMGRLLSEGRGVCGLTVQAVQLVDDTDRARSARAVTGSDGSYRLAVTAGRWSVSILEGRPVQTGCAEVHREVWRPEPPEVIVTVGLGETKIQNLAGVEANASLSGGTARPASVSVPLQGRLVASAAPVTLNGGIAARLVESSEPATTAPIVNGAFLLNLKPGTYRLEVGIPTNGGFLPGAPQQITVGEGENTPIEIPVTPYDAVIQGTVRRPDGSPLTGEAVTVFASNGAGGAVEESSDPATGVFRLRV